ncbi:hypothetical protein [Sedimentitalea todarodis]|uniref:Uncharacterized protein n=1 Tax=Sedimentitalea todarodis TaxID=1631240 RepID=A0ABU3VB25_9RHOB|nr:hypothetical protein [Sedimentitalea todarodis]MDU9003364.1 hypothetical protein [Sedimentitalea todarodis]
MQVRSKFLMLGAASVMSLCTALSATAEDAKVKEVTVDVAIDASDDSNVLELYPQLQNDLETAVIERVATADDPEGYIVDVTLQDVSLDGDSLLPDSMEFNQMEGVVAVTSPQTNATPVTRAINLVAMSADGSAPEGYVVIEPSKADFYFALINAFADEVADNLPEYMREAAR